jgi:hypothetical protein
LRYKIPLGILVLSLVVSVTVNAYFYTLAMDRQAQTNKLLGQTISTWAREMNVAGYYTNNATTSAALVEIDSLFMIAKETANTLLVSDHQTVYSYMALTAEDVAENLFPYSVGPPTDPRNISQPATEMFAVLYAKIQNLTSLFDTAELTHLDGTNPIHLLEERGLVDSIIANCTDILNYAAEIGNFSPKFQ